MIRICERCGLRERKVYFRSKYCKDCQVKISKLKTYLNKKKEHICMSCDEKVEPYYKIKCNSCLKEIKKIKGKKLK